MFSLSQTILNKKDGKQDLARNETRKYIMIISNTVISRV